MELKQAMAARRQATVGRDCAPKHRGLAVATAASGVGHGGLKLPQAPQWEHGDAQ